MFSFGPPTAHCVLAVGACITYRPYYYKAKCQAELQSSQTIFKIWCEYGHSVQREHRA